MVYPVLHLDDTPEPAEVEPEVTESTCMAPIIGASFNLEVAAGGDRIATERWHRLLDYPDVGRTAGSLWIGSCQEAVQWAGQHVAYVVNAAERGYKWHPWCLRFWANIHYMRLLNNVGHDQRMEVVVWLILTAMMIGEDVLVHCRQGKHTSTVVCLLIMILMSGRGRPKSWCHSEGLDVLEPDLILDPPWASRREVFGKTNLGLEGVASPPVWHNYCFRLPASTYPFGRT